VTAPTKTQAPARSTGVAIQKPGPSPLRWLVPLALIIGAGAGAGWWWTHEKDASAGAPAPQRSNEHHRAAEGTETGTGTVHVEVVYPRKGGITRSSTQPGSVHWFEAAELYAKVAGYLKELSVDIGDPVKEGQLLAVIDNPEIIEDAARAVAALTQAKATVAQSEARIKTSEADLRAAHAMVKKAEADIERYTSTRRYREKALARYRGLLAQQAVQQQIVDEEEEHYESAIAAEHSAQADVFTARAKVVSAEAMVEQARADLAEAKANVGVDESNLARARVLVDYTRIVSPYTGIVTFRGFHRGDFIRSAENNAEKPILTVARTDKVRVVTHIPDRDVPYTDVHDKATLRLDALPDDVFEGTVSRFASTEDPQSRTMRTEVDLPNPENRLREGMYGTLTITLNQSTDCLTIPTAALTNAGQGKASIFIVNNGHVNLTTVKTGFDDGLHVEIFSNLKPDDQVVLNPGQVTDGIAVEAVVKSEVAKK
jgi:RND family efflux transporter MFP subunit